MTRKKHTWWPPSVPLVDYNERKDMVATRSSYSSKKEKTTWRPPSAPLFKYEEKNDLVATKFLYIPRRGKKNLVITRCHSC
jgi:hypothetical protein